MIEGRRHGQRSGAAVAWVVLFVAVASAPAPSWAFSLFSKPAAKSHNSATVRGFNADDVAALVRQALDELRYVDAGTWLDQAKIDGVHSPELTILNGQLFLARGRFAEALEMFRPVAAETPPNGRALEGEGIALSMLGRSDEAMAALKAATGLDKALWRGWNCLGREYDLRRDWTNAGGAYAAALAAPGVRSAMVLNNRGYSLLLQNKPTEASADFIAALAKEPALAAARTNLRLALAWQGAYDRAAVTGAGDDRAAVLNNVGLAAALRGDYVQADKYLTEAMAAKGQYYDRASENLQLSRSLADRKDPASTSAPNVAR